MHILLVHLRVKPECLDAFKAATRENARQSALEPGVIRFDVVQQNDDPTRFALIEVYRVAEGYADHRKTPHYEVWRDTVPPMLAEPRAAVQYTNVYPTDDIW